MAKVTDLSELSAAPAAGDLLPIVDVSDTTHDASGTTKYVTTTNLATTVQTAAGLLPKTAGSGEGVTGVLYLDPGADDAANVLRIPVTSADGEDFRMNLGKAVFLTTDDITFNWGFNVATGGQADTAAHAWYLQLEYSYNEGGTLQCEYHLNLAAATGTPAFRPMQFKTRADGTNSETSIKGDIFRIQGRGDETGIIISDIGGSSQSIVTASSTTEVRVGNISNSFRLVNTTAGYDIINMNIDAVTNKANQTYWYNTSGANLMILSNAAKSLSVYGNINYLPTTDVYPVFVRGVAGQTKQLLYLGNSADAIQFAIGATGRIQTNQASANTATPSGATAQQLPIYNAAGALLGYVPIYGSAWT